MTALYYWRRLLPALAAVLIAACTASTLDTRGFSLSDAPLVGKIVWHDLMTDDPFSAQRFYGELLGWDFEQAERPDGQPYILAQSGGRYVGGIVEVPDLSDGTDFSRWLGYLSVEDVETAVALTRSAGGSVVIAPREVGQIGTAAVIRDPQGAPIGLLRIRMGDPDDGQPASSGSIGWNELLASDPESATAFYSSIAGYETRRIDRFKGPYHVLSDGIRDRAGVFSNPLDGTEPFWLTHFLVDDVAASTARVEELGGKVLLAPSDEFRDGRFALVMDPGGAVLVLRDGSAAGGKNHD